MKKKFLSVCMVMLLLGFLLLNPSESAAGSRAGLTLWFQSVLPVLLPFFVLSRLLISLDGLTPVMERLNPLAGRIWGLSPMGAYALLLGFLCGYPMGAKISADLVREEKITREEGAYLLLFCNNVSPAFLLGFCMTEHLKAPSLIPATLGIVYGTPLFLALFWRKGRSFQGTAFNHRGPGRTLQQKQASGFQINFKIVDACIMDGLESILKLGCYIILFSITARLAALIPWPRASLSALCAGGLEITNGISAVCQLPLPFFPRYMAVLAFTVFGGLSGIAQTDSMLAGSSLPIGAYVKAKLITVLSALLIACGIFILLPGLLPPR